MRSTQLLLVAAATLTTCAVGARPDRAVPTLEQRWQVETRGHLPLGVAADDRAVYVAVKSGGVTILDRASGRRLAGIGRASLGGLDAMNLVLRGKRLYVALGEIFRTGARPGLAVIDVADPAKPRVLGHWAAREGAHGSTHVDVADDVAYLCAMSSGLITLDVRDPAAIRHLATYQPDIHFPVRNPNRVRRPNARGLAIRGKRVYLAYDAGGLRVLDVADPRRPREIGRYVNPAMGKKPQAYNNIVLDGDRAFIAVDYAGLEILDIGKPQAIKQIGWWNPWHAEQLGNLWVNSPGHTNQLGYDAERKRVVLSAGASEVLEVDVSTPSAPRLAARFGSTRNREGVWGLALAGRDVFAAYIKAAVPFRGTWSGVRALRRVR